MPPPAVEHAQPGAIARWRRTNRIASLATVLLIIPFFLMPSNPSTVDMTLLGAAFAMYLGSLLWLIVLYTRYRRIIRALRTRPLPCLHCLYPLALDQPTCPECGRLQNRCALSDPWKKRLHI